MSKLKHLMTQQPLDLVWSSKQAESIMSDRHSSNSYQNVSLNNN